MENKKIKYFIYARKSSESDERQVQSIEDQVRIFEAIAEKNSINIIGTLSEAKSAKIPDKRNEFNALLKRIKAGEASGILCWKLDRLARNPDEAGKILGMLQRGEIMNIKTIEKDYFPQDNALISYVEFGMADQYSRDLSINVKRGLKSKLEKGWRPGSAPIGYLNTKIEARGENYITKDPAIFSIVRRAWDFMLTGNFTADQILEKVNKEWGFLTHKSKKRGGKPMGRSSIYRIFTNIFYAGMIEHHPGGKKTRGGKDPIILPGKHPAMVTLEEFDQVQILLGRKGKPRPNENHSYTLTGIVHCGECGGAISATTKQKILKSTKQIKSYELYYCVCARKYKKCSQRFYTNYTEITEQIIERISQIEIIPEFRDWALEVLNSQADQDFEAHNKIVEANQKALASAERQLSNLTRMRMLDQLEDEEYDKERIRLKNEVATLKVKTSQIDMQKKSWVELTKKAFVFACNAGRAFNSGDAEVKRSILIGIGLNWTIFDHILAFYEEDWFTPFKKQASCEEAQKERFEPAKTALFETKTDPEGSVCPNWRGIVDTVRTRIQENEGRVYMPDLRPRVGI